MSKGNEMTPAAPNEIAKWWQWALSIPQESHELKNNGMIGVDLQ